MISEQDLAERVLNLRLWQMIINEDLKQNRYLVPVHVALGHEAIAVAVDEVLAPDDALLLTHRNMAYNLARERALDPVRRQYEQGALGSMNLANPQRGILYSSSILGNNLPVACGVAMTDKIAGRPAVTWVLTGDGALEEGSFWESLLFARSHRLPLAVIIENNDHSLASRIAERRSPVDLAALASSLDIAFLSLAGNQVEHYRASLAALRLWAAGGNPVLVEVQVKTLSNHAGPTPGWAADPKRISLEAGLVIEETPADPAWVARQCFPSNRWAAFEGSLLALALAIEQAGQEASATCPTPSTL